MLHAPFSNLSFSSSQLQHPNIASGTTKYGSSQFHDISSVSNAYITGVLFAPFDITFGIPALSDNPLHDTRPVHPITPDLNAGGEAIYRHEESCKLWPVARLACFLQIDMNCKERQGPDSSYRVGHPRSMSSYLLPIPTVCESAIIEPIPVPCSTRLL